MAGKYKIPAPPKPRGVFSSGWMRNALWMRRRDAPTAEVQYVRPINPRLHTNVLKKIGEKYVQRITKEEIYKLLCTCNDSNKVNALPNRNAPRDFFPPRQFCRGADLGYSNCFRHGKVWLPRTAR